MKLLLDPRLLIFPSETSDRKQLIEIWGRIVDWSSDSRIAIGTESLEHVWNHFGEVGYPEKDLAMYPPALRNEYRQALNKIMSRIIEHCNHPTELDVRPEYVGSEEQKNALTRDVAGTAGGSIVGIASTRSSWSEDCVKVWFTPPPPSELEICVDARSPLAIETRATVEAALRGRRVHIVGGKPNQRIYKSIFEMTGIRESDIHWIAAEKSKPPRDLDKKWGSLRPDRDIAICITGRIGHAQSERAATTAAKAGVIYLPLESANEIESALVEVIPRMREAQGWRISEKD
ncbi:DUF2325 domain-containing protein [Rhodococcus sp. NPDC019627]|uniref:DUF2325 domain-containing protein n=1 Tax=Rhodococcus TaxID=1827 RepID=UPI000A8D3442|nr:DUF2325 domain-containing protein [Rhodococcus opacus]